MNNIKGYKLTDKESMNMLMNEIDEALTIPANFEKIVSPLLVKGVSTISDECKRVGVEMSTTSKRKAT